MHSRRKEHRSSERGRRHELARKAVFTGLEAAALIALARRIGVRRMGRGAMLLAGSYLTHSDGLRHRH